jgi:hypothetical protein
MMAECEVTTSPVEPNQRDDKETKRSVYSRQRVSERDRTVIVLTGGSYRARGVRDLWCGKQFEKKKIKKKERR